MDDRGDPVDRIQPKRPGEFVCQSCFLVKHPSQLADADACSAATACEAAMPDARRHRRRPQPPRPPARPVRLRPARPAGRVAGARARAGRDRAQHVAAGYSWPAGRSVRRRTGPPAARPRSSPPPRQRHRCGIGASAGADEALVDDATVDRRPRRSRRRRHGSRPGHPGLRLPGRLAGRPPARRADPASWRPCGATRQAHRGRQAPSSARSPSSSGSVTAPVHGGARPGRPADDCPPGRPEPRRASQVIQRGGALRVACASWPPATRRCSHARRDRRRRHHRRHRRRLRRGGVETLPRRHDARRARRLYVEAGAREVGVGEAMMDAVLAWCPSGAAAGSTPWPCPATGPRRTSSSASA